jgi:hypothetical protein
MLHEVCHALENSECHCGLISLRFNVTKFPRPVAIKGNLVLVAKGLGVQAETR